MKSFLAEISKGQFKIHGFVREIGQDILVSIWGGTRPHIGAVGMAIPMPSLKNQKNGALHLQTLFLSAIKKAPW